MDVIIYLFQGKNTNNDEVINKNINDACENFGTFNRVWIIICMDFLCSNWWMLNFAAYYKPVKCWFKEVWCDADS